LAAMRAMPGLRLIRPADANETAVAWQVAIDNDGPTALVLTRQDVPVVVTPEQAQGLRAGAYVVSDSDGVVDPEEDLDIVLIGTGSEVAVCLDAKPVLEAEGLKVRVVSMPSWTLFAALDDDARSRGGVVLRLGPLGRRHRFDRPVRCLGAGERRAGEVRVHRGPRRPQGKGAAGRPRRRGGLMGNLRRLYDEFGQSPWLDNLKRGWITSGELARWIERGVRGITSNPTIFAKAIWGATDYDEQFCQLATQGRTVEDAYWEMVTRDIEDALA